MYTAVKALVAGMLLASLTAPGLSDADAGRPQREFGPQPRREFGAQPGRFLEEEYAERLGLAAETLAAIHTIVETSRSQSHTLRAQLHQAYMQMRRLLSQETPDPAAVMQQADTIGALELAERKNRLQAMLQIRALLTPAQRQQLLRLQRELPMRGRFGSQQDCQADSANLCPNADSWRARLQCLRDHLSELSEACSAALPPNRSEEHGP